MFFFCTIFFIVAIFFLNPTINEDFKFYENFTIVWTKYLVKNIKWRQTIMFHTFSILKIIPSCYVMDDYHLFNIKWFFQTTSWQCYFFQFYDVAEVAIIYKLIYPNFTIKKMKGIIFSNKFWYLIKQCMENLNFH